MSSAQTDPGRGAPPTVSVVGEAILRAESDEALVIVSLTALKDSPGLALEDVASRSQALVALLDEPAIASADRSTTGVSVHEEFGSGSKRPAKPPPTADARHGHTPTGSALSSAR